MEHDPHLQLKVSELIATIRNKCLRRGAGGLERLRVKLDTRDEAKEKLVEPEHFRETLRQFGVVLSNQELDMLTIAFKDASGYLKASTISTAICDTLNPRRKALVDALFDKIDVNGNGILEVDDLKACADFSRHPLVLNYSITEEEAARQYLDVFDETPDGQIARAEWHAYYNGVSEQVTSDEYFEEMVRSAWRIVDVDDVVHTANVNLSGKNKSRTPTPFGAPGERMVPSARGAWDPNAAASRLNKKQPAARPEAPRNIVGFSGHVPMAQERFGETYHASLKATPGLTKTVGASYTGAEYADEGNAFVRQGNKANAHSFKLA
jgi:Ca2+-binding EF-hand superfamily protein